MVLAASCPRLPPIRNGWLLPSTCNNGYTYSGEACRIYCKKGYKLRHNSDVVTCNEQLSWEWNEPIGMLQDICIRDFPHTFIKCPGNGQLTYTLPFGQRHMYVRIPQPETNANWKQDVRSDPSWGMQLGTILPAGKTELSFYSAKGNKSDSTSCRLVITILDIEDPKMYDCPTNMVYTLPRHKANQLVYWQEPRFTDNVDIATLYRSREPGTEFGPGLHHVNYVASDEAGNRAFCHFTVEIKEELALSASNAAPLNLQKESSDLYKAVLVCPDQQSSKFPRSHLNQRVNEAGCYWKHVRVSEAQKLPSIKIHKESRLPPHLRKKHNYFHWYDKCC